MEQSTQNIFIVEEMPVFVNMGVYMDKDSKERLY